MQYSKQLEEIGYELTEEDRMALDQYESFLENILYDVFNLFRLLDMEEIEEIRENHLKGKYGKVSNDMLPLLANDSIEAYIIYYFDGVLKGKVCIDYSDMNIAPVFRSLIDCIEFLLKVEESFEDFVGTLQYPSDTNDIAIKDAEYNQAVTLLDKIKKLPIEDNMRTYMLCCAIAIMPNENCKLLLEFLDIKEEEIVLNALFQKILFGSCLEAFEPLKRLIQIYYNKEGVKCVSVIQTAKWLLKEIGVRVIDKKEIESSELEDKKEEVLHIDSAWLRRNIKEWQERTCQTQDPILQKIL